MSGTVKIKQCTATGFLNKNDGLWNEVNNSTKKETNYFNIYVNDVLVHQASTTGSN